MTWHRLTDYQEWEQIWSSISSKFSFYWWNKRVACLWAYHIKPSQNWTNRQHVYIPYFEWFRGRCTKECHKCYSWASALTFSLWRVRNRLVLCVLIHRVGYSMALNLCRWCSFYGGIQGPGGSQQRKIWPLLLETFYSFSASRIVHPELK